MGDLEGLEEYCDNWEIGNDSSLAFTPTGNTAADGVPYHYASIAKEKV